MHSHFLAIEIGGSKLQICAGTSAGEIVGRVRFEVDKSSGGAGIRKHVADVLPEMKARWNAAAIGVGYGGPVDWRTGTIKCSHPRVSG